MMELDELGRAVGKGASHSSAAVESSAVPVPSPNLPVHLTGVDDFEVLERSRTHEEEQAPPTKTPLNKKAVVLLLAQHTLSTWGARSFEFAWVLFMAILFPRSLLPASIYGFAYVGTAIIFSGAIGNLVDTTPRLRMVRSCIAAQKGSVSVAYAIYLAMFLKLRSRTEVALETGDPLVWAFFAVLVVVGAILNLSTIAINVSIERDWITSISDHDDDKLTVLNAYIRRIDLLSQLLAPLFISLLTVTVSYTFVICFMLGYSFVTCIAEMFWIGVVYRSFPILESDEELRLEAVKAARKLAEDKATAELSTRFHRKLAKIGRTLRQQASDWQEFVVSPVFPSSLAIALLYLSVLSFDGAMITFLKSHAYSDSFIAGMRGTTVVTGLMGTVVMPFLEKHIGLVRAGTWSIVQELVFLIPVLLSLFVGAPNEGQRGVPWNEAMLFTGMALSRIGLWSFDLCQTKELQVILRDHPRRNSITALQYSLQNILDLLKFVLTMVLSRPSQFKWAALVSVGSVALAVVSYVYYARRERGHLIHFPAWWEKVALLHEAR